MALARSKETCSSGDCVGLTARESMVCRVICGAPGPVSFGQLKKETDLHQEVVSRILRRLTVHGIVEKSEGRYRSLCLCCCC